MKLTAFLAWALLGSVGLAHAGIYKWVDDQGRVHYGERPPAAAQAREVTIEKAPPPDPERAENLRRSRQFVEIREHERALREQAEAEQQRRREALKHNCRVATGRLNALRRAGRVYDLDDNGNRLYRDADGRQRAIGRAEAEVRKWCRD